MEQIIKKRQALKTFANWSELNKQTRNDIAYMRTMETEDNFPYKKGMTD